jgi:hypothetical protein
VSDETMKFDPDDANEVHDLATFKDPDQNVITPVLQLPPEVMQPFVEAFIRIVRAGHENEACNAPDEDGVTRAQIFEEGDVYMLEKPFDGYFADRYLMDFYNVRDRGICSRMHLHTGLRFVRMNTGIDTVIRVSSLSPFKIATVPGVHGFALETFEDQLPDTPDGLEVTRYNAVVPPCSIVDMQVPRGVSHQFNAIGPNALIDSVHPEETIETFREKMSGLKMMSQTIFLAEELPDSDTCVID